MSEKKIKDLIKKLKEAGFKDTKHVIDEDDIDFSSDESIEIIEDKKKGISLSIQICEKFVYGSDFFIVKMYKQKPQLIMQQIGKPSSDVSTVVEYVKAAYNQFFK